MFEDEKTAELADSPPKANNNLPLHVGFQFSYDLGDEPDEEDDEMNNTDGEGEEGEDEQDDILIVEGDDEGIDDDEVDCEGEDRSESPNLRGKSAKNYREIYNCSSAENPSELHKKGAARMGGLTPANNNKSLNVS